MGLNGLYERSGGGPWCLQTHRSSILRCEVREYFRRWWEQHFHPSFWVVDWEATPVQKDESRLTFIRGTFPVANPERTPYILERQLANLEGEFLVEYKARKATLIERWKTQYEGRKYIHDSSA